MAETTIQWADFTFNPWVGCQRVSPGCVHCYAEAYDKRVGGVPVSQRPTPDHPAMLRWGPNAPRTRTSESYWRQPLKWNREAEKAGVRKRVFCASLADVFEDRPELVAWREDLWALIMLTPNLDWLLLTKRPENIVEFMPSTSAFGRLNDSARRLSGRGDIAVVPTQRHGMVSFEWPLPNVWLGCTVEDELRAKKRVEHLRAAPAVVHFLSCEPLLEYPRFAELLVRRCRVCDGTMSVPVEGGGAPCVACLAHQGVEPAIDWVIVGGESGANARPFQIEWAREIVHDCHTSGIAPFVKQLGSKPTQLKFTGKYGGILSNVPLYSHESLKLKDGHGGDMAEWPLDLRVREFPEVRS